MRRFRTPAVALFLLSPIIAELLSGSAPPAEFFNPVTLLFLIGFYGSGALLARELTHRWGKGWPTLLTLGAAYGIIEEGLAVKSFFDPNWMDLGALAHYGRWAGVNWVWVAELTLFHAVFSVAIPVLLVETLFPEHRDRPWVRPKRLRWLAALFAAISLLIHFFLTPYRPPFVPFLLAALAVVALGLRARRLPPAPAADPPRRLPSPRRLGVTAFLATAVFFLGLSWIIPETPIPAVVDLLLFAALATWIYRKVARASRHPGWTRRHALALATGGLAFLLLLQPIIELQGGAGATLAGLAGALALAWLWRRQSRLEAGEAGSPKRASLSA